MNAIKKLSMRLTPDEYRYALALSKRVPGCKRPECGSIAHGLRWALREQARREGLKMFDAGVVYTSHSA